VIGLSSPAKHCGPLCRGYAAFDLLDPRAHGLFPRSGAIQRVTCMPGDGGATSMLDALAIR
jgi:hypothetical protein